MFRSTFLADVGMDYNASGISGFPNGRAKRFHISQEFGTRIKYFRWRSLSIKTIESNLACRIHEVEVFSRDPNHSWIEPGSTGIVENELRNSMIITLDYGT